MNNLTRIMSYPHNQRTGAESSLKTPLQKAREATDLTQEQVSVRAGITQSHYSRIETAEWACSSVVARKLARIFVKQGINELHVLYPKRFRVFKSSQADR